MGKKQHAERNNLIKIAAFGTATAASGALFVTSMIQNGKGAVERYDTLQAVDAAGGDVEAALTELRSFIYAHMNTEIGGSNSIYPPIQLKGTYDRLVAAEAQRVKDINDNLYSEAQAYCETTGNQGFSGSNRLDCINQYVDNNGAKPQQIEDSLYKYDFVAPRWSPDVAGFSLLAFIIFGLITLWFIAAHFRTRHIVHMAN
jgi:hypothetical protein